MTPKPKPTKKATKTSRKTGGKKAKIWPVVFCGEEQKLCTCPHRKRLVVVKNEEGARKGFFIRRAEDGALVCWARLKGHATEAMEKLEDLLDLCGGKLQEKTVRHFRHELSEL